MAWHSGIPLRLELPSNSRSERTRSSFQFDSPTLLPFTVRRAAVLKAASERGKHGLQRMAKETGGVSYEVTKSESIEAIYSQIEDALRNQYSIGYTPPRTEADGKYHKIKLTTRDRHLTVHARDGYYSK